MARGYTKSGLMIKVDKWLTPEKVSMLYAQDFINYKGITSDTKEKYTEIIAEHLLNNIDVFENIERITRESSYDTGHKWKPIDPTSPRKEEQIARSMMGQTYHHIGEIIDYQTPLKNVQSDYAGKIDLLSWNEKKKCIYIIEFKGQESQETLLRSMLELDIYNRIVNHEKLLESFDIPEKTEVRKAVLVYQGTQPYADIGDANVRKLRKALGVDVFVLNKDNQVIEEHYCFGMRTLLVWENCHIFDGKTAFWVEVPLETFRSDIQGLDSETNIYMDSIDEYLKEVENAAEILPDKVRKNYVYLLVREDGKAYKIPKPTYPYSPMWNAYCPFVVFQKEIDNLSCLSQLDIRKINNSSDDEL